MLIPGWEEIRLCINFQDWQRDDKYVSTEVVERLYIKAGILRENLDLSSLNKEIAWNEKELDRKIKLRDVLK